MGPRRLRRGRRGLALDPVGGHASFNGATAFTPWKACVGICGSSGVGGFNGATAFTPWKEVDHRCECGHGEASMGPRRLRRGRFAVSLADFGKFSLQWGHGVYAVEGSLNLHSHAAITIASMGPRRLRRGRVGIALSPGARNFSFNGATAFTPWKESARNRPSQQHLRLALRAMPI